MMKHLVRVIRWVGALLVILIAIIAIVWAFGAVWFDAPFGNANKVLAGLLAVASVAALIFVRPFWCKLGAAFVAFRLVLSWWLTLKPSHHGNWQPDVAQLASEDINGDEFTFHKVRQSRDRAPKNAPSVTRRHHHRHQEAPHDAPSERAPAMGLAHSAQW